MCPACAATMALIFGSVISTGGAAAIIAKKFGAKKFGVRKFEADKIGADKFEANGAARNASAQEREKEKYNGQRQA